MEVKNSTELYVQDERRLMSALAETIRTLRVQKGLSQKELARLVGVSTAAVSSWEVGKRQNIRGKTLFQLAEALGVGPEEFLSRTETTETGPIDERQLLSTYRQLPAERRRIALHLVKALQSAS